LKKGLESTTRVVNHGTKMGEVWEKHKKTKLAKNHVNLTLTADPGINGGKN